jgi:hypothetical protein
MQHVRRGEETVRDDRSGGMLRAHLVARHATHDALLPPFRRVDLVLVDETERIREPRRILEAQRLGLVALAQLGQLESARVRVQIKNRDGHGLGPQIAIRGAHEKAFDAAALVAFFPPRPWHFSALTTEVPCPHAPRRHIAE